MVSNRRRRQAASDRLRISPAFWTLASFIVVMFLTGGGARADIQSLVVLRPVAILICAYALWSIRRENVTDRRLLFSLAGCVFAIGLIYILPLPPALWRSLPGHAIVAQIDDLTGVGAVWRPLTLAPAFGWNAFYALFIPLAVLLLAAQLGAREHVALLPILIVMGALSALLGALQVVGDPDSLLYLYNVTNRGSAVGLFANRNHAAVFLAALFPILAVYVSQPVERDDQGRFRLICAVAGAFFIIPLILVTGSRGGLFAGLVGLLSVPLLVRRDVLRGASSGRRNPVLLVAGLSALALAALTVLLARAQAFDRLFSADAAEDDRWTMWNPITRIARDFFPFGSGTGSFEQVYQLYEPVDQLRTTYANHAHNELLEVYMTLGWVGVAIVGACLATWLAASWRAWRTPRGEDRPGRDLARLGSVLLAIMFLASLADYPLRTPALAGLATLAAVWLSGVGRHPHKASAD